MTSQRASVAASLVAVLLGVVPCFAQPSPTSIPAGTALTFRMLDAVASDDDASARVLRATLMSPIIRDGVTAVAPGASAYAHIVRAGTDSARRHVLRISFDSATLNGVVTPLNARVIAVDNAREVVDTTGLITGPPSGRTLRNKRTWALMAFGVAHPVAAAALFGASKVRAHEREREIRYAAGTDFATVTTEPLVIANASTPHVWRPILPADSLQRIVRSWPVNTEAEAGRVGADLLNVALLGDSATILDALHAAGWDSAKPMSFSADLATFFRAAQDRGYSHQPVSTLLMNGQRPSLVFERVTNTFAKRHHVRLWHWTTALDGSAVWLASASHDVAIAFLRDRRHFTHRIDPAVDHERDKLTDDLWAAGCIDARSDVRRTLPTNLFVNDGHDPIVTDGTLIVLRLREPCVSGRSR